MRFVAARYLASDAERMREITDKLREKRDSGRWNFYGLGDFQESRKKVRDRVMNFHPTHLTSMRHFRVCDANERTWKILADSCAGFDTALLERIQERFRHLDMARTRQCSITYEVLHAAELGEVRLEYGWRTHEGPPGHYCQLSCTNTIGNIEERYSFMEEFIERLGLEDIVLLQGNEQEFELAVSDGWSFYEFSSWDKRNPHYFPIGPFPSMDDVCRRADGFLASPLGGKIDRLCISFTMTPDIYETMYDGLNDMADLWYVDFYGSYADGIDLCAADASASPNGRFPLFVWSPARDVTGLFYEADVVPCPEGRFLEIHSNCGEMKKLLKEAKAATGEEFASVPTQSV